MTVVSVSPDPVPAGQTVTITFTGGPPVNVVVKTVPGGQVVNVPAGLGKNSVAVGAFPAAGGYQITITNGLGDSVSPGVTAE